MGHISTLGYAAAGLEPDVTPDHVPHTDEASSHYLYPHEKKYLEDEKKRVKAHKKPRAYDNVKKLLEKGEEALPKNLTPIQKLPESGEWLSVVRK